MKRTGNVVTKVGQWQQRSLFDSATLRPYRKDRYKYIRARLAQEKKEGAR
jgi:hypothetical protein